MIPSYPQFLRWTKKFSVIPFCIALPKKISGDPFPYFCKIAQGKKNTFFLDSFNTLPNGSFSYFPLTEPDSCFTAKNKREFMLQWSSLKQKMSQMQGPSLPKEFPSFYGGAVGILSYDCGRFFEKGWQSEMPKDTLHFPLMSMGIYKDLVCFNHRKDQAMLFSCFIKEKNERNLKKIYEQKKEELNQLAETFFPASSIPIPFSSLSKGKETKQEVQWQKNYFLDSVAKIKEYIAAGDIYQANLSQRIAKKFSGEPLDFYSRLRKINPSPYACYFRVQGFEIVSCSPELLLKKIGRMLRTRPIAGTRPRGESLQKDKKLTAELLLSQKERAEHIMLVDLERNDLGKVCVRGSVRVTEKMAIEKYSHVMHIVSEVEGKIKNGLSIFEALPAVFPGGTITGCPKIRCMEILDELEPVARGPFFGSAGYIGFQGNATFNLLIRTAVIIPSLRSPFVRGRVREGRPPSNLFIQVGSGIVADSIPELEYQESMHKAAALLSAFKV